MLPHAEQLATEGHITGASARNWAGYHQDITLAPNINPIQQALLTDPQTSGGLLVACADDAVTDVISLFHSQGFAHASVIGELVNGPPGVEVVSE